MSIWIECARVECVTCIETQTHTVVPYNKGRRFWGDRSRRRPSSDERATYICFRVFLVCTEGL
jgi:hypothetical protein